VGAHGGSFFMTRSSSMSVRSAADTAAALDGDRRFTAMKKLRIVRLGFGTARQKMALA
jgi:hypothetical protein